MAAICTKAALRPIWLPGPEPAMKQRSFTRKKARRCLLVCIFLLLLSAGIACALVLHANQVARQREEAARAAAQAAAEEQAAREAAAAEAARQEEEQRQAEEAAALRQQQVADAAAAHDAVEYGDKLGTIRVEGTQIDCALYWGDSSTQFDAGAGCHVMDGCVLPGENGTVFIGAHTGTYFADLGSAEVGDRIYLDTDWGSFVYEITEMQVIYETDVDKVRWGAEEPSCVLYTCYPFGVLTHTDRRYAVYADPVAADADGVIPQ